jgi:hypothetical protein
MEAPVATQDTAQSVKPVAADSIDKTFSDSIGVFFDNANVSYNIP